MIGAEVELTGSVHIKFPPLVAKPPLNKWMEPSSYLLIRLSFQFQRMSYVDILERNV